jgi:hypothetical protein
VVAAHSSCSGSAGRALSMPTHLHCCGLWLGLAGWGNGGRVEALSARERLIYIWQQSRWVGLLLVGQNSGGG